jgi:hypothetical protein
MTIFFCLTTLCSTHWVLAIPHMTLLQEQVCMPVGGKTEWLRRPVLKTGKSSYVTTLLEVHTLCITFRDLRQLSWKVSRQGFGNRRLWRANLLPQDRRQHNEVSNLQSFRYLYFVVSPWFSSRKNKRFFSISRRPDLLWIPPSLLYKGFWELLHSG